MHEQIDRPFNILGDKLYWNDTSLFERLNFKVHGKNGINVIFSHNSQIWTLKAILSQKGCLFGSLFAAFFFRWDTTIGSEICGTTFTANNANFHKVEPSTHFLGRVAPIGDISFAIFSAFTTFLTGGGRIISRGSLTSVRMVGATSTSLLSVESNKKNIKLNGNSKAIFFSWKQLMRTWMMFYEFLLKKYLKASLSCDTKFKMATSLSICLLHAKYKTFPLFTIFGNRYSRELCSVTRMTTFCWAE